MNNAEINVAIAKALGAKQCPIHLGYECCGNQLQDYATDLNAMAQVESTLSDKDSESYYWRLVEILFGHINAFRFISASSRHRAEAFLRFKGLWKESDNRPCDPA